MTASFEQRLAERLLDSRTRALAERRQAAERDAAMTRVLALTLGADRYGIPLPEALRVTAFTGCTPVPGTVPAVRGIIGLHGRIHTVLDLAMLLGRTTPDDLQSGHLIVLRKPRPRLALRCSRVLGAVDVAPLGSGERPGDAPPAVAGYGRVPDDSPDFPRAVLALIDPGRLLAGFQTVKQESSS
jgi:purine-binding chemotaxis protein CheW